MNKFKKAIQSLREIEHEHGHIGFIEELVAKRMRGYEKANYPELSESQLNFLEAVGLEYKYKSVIGEWEITLTENN